MKYFANIELIKRISQENMSSASITTIEKALEASLHALIESEKRILILEKKISDLEIHIKTMQRPYELSIVERFKIPNRYGKNGILHRFLP
jgi:hypothetical protein